MELSLHRTKAARSLRGLVCASLLASACGDDEPSSKPNDDAGVAVDAGGVQDAGGSLDGNRPDGLDGAFAGSDAGADGSTMQDASCGADPCPADPLAPFQLDCANLPTGTPCQGGPREVLLVIARYGHVLMFDPLDGHFLGYFKREAAESNTQGISGFSFATQGPDQCIWTVTEAEPVGVQRWNPDGTFRDAPLEPRFFPVAGQPDEPAIQNPLTIAFSRDRLFVASHYGTPNPRVTRWQLDGRFDAVALEEELEVRSLLVLGDGSLLVADNLLNRVVRVPAGGGPSAPVLGGLDTPAQLSYSGGGKVLVADDDYAVPLYEVEIATGRATTIYPAMDADGARGIAALKNGKWLVTGEDFQVAVLDPASSNPSGQYQVVWTDNAVAPGSFFHVGRACLAEAFLASRASKPAQDVCIEPPQGPELFREDFENGAFEGSGTSRRFNAFYDVGVPEVMSSIDETGGVEGSRALRINGAGTIDTGDPSFPQGHKTGMYATFPGGRPSYIRYQVRVPAGSGQSLGYLLLENAAANPEEDDWLGGTTFDDGVLEALQSNAETATALVDQWVRIELRNIDWGARTYDLYVNCTRLAEGIGLPTGLGDAIDRLDLYNYPFATDANTVAWYDDILIK